MKTSVPTLATIGYEAVSFPAFVATLRQAGVSTLLDVRELPLSRRKGFSKTSLRQGLEEAGIAYVHLRGLGDPKAGREAARGGNYSLFRRIFRSHLASAEAAVDLKTATEFASAGGACLMCYEAAPETCHRSIVADTISQTVSILIRHLKVDASPASPRESRRSATQSRTGADSR